MNEGLSTGFHGITNFFESRAAGFQSKKNNSNILWLQSYVGLKLEFLHCTPWTKLHKSYVILLLNVNSKNILIKE